MPRARPETVRRTTRPDRFAVHRITAPAGRHV